MCPSREAFVSFQTLLRLLRGLLSWQEPSSVASFKDVYMFASCFRSGHVLPARPTDSINLYLICSRLRFDCYFMKIRDQTGPLSPVQHTELEKNKWMSLVRVSVQPRLLGWSVHLTTDESRRYKDRQLDSAKCKHSRLKKGNTRTVSSLVFAVIKGFSTSRCYLYVQRSMGGFEEGRWFPPNLTLCLITGTYLSWMMNQ